MFDQIKKSATKCEICQKEIAAQEEKMVVERQTIHKNCFKCAYCDEELKMGRCAIERLFFHRFGPLYYCHKHSLLPPGEKETQLVKRGVQERAKKKK